MPRNKRVAKDMKAYNLKLEHSDYEKLQEIAEANGLPVSTLLQKIISDFTKNKTVSIEVEDKMDKIKSLPLKERQAAIKKVSKLSTDN